PAGHSASSTRPRRAPRKRRASQTRARRWTIASGELSAGPRRGSLGRRRQPCGHRRRTRQTCCPTIAPFSQASRAVRGAAAPAATCSGPAGRR
ncbi:unnamed protein product, partial [Prorocentrum cordatum]